MKSMMFLGQFMRDMRSQKLRTFLTLLGITWGTISITLLLAFGVGLDRQLKKSMHGLGEGLIIIRGGKTSLPYMGLNKGRPIRIREEDAALIEREVPTVTHALPEYNRSSVGLKYGKNTYSAFVKGVYPEYGEIRNVIPERGGRFLNPIDFRQKRRVIFLGFSVKKELFKDEEAVGKIVTLNGVPFQVVGQLIEKIQNSSYGNRDEYSVFIPASTFSALFGHRYINNMVIKSSDPRRNEVIQEDVYRVLGEKMKFDPADTEALWIWDLMENEKLSNAITLGFNLFLGIVGAFTLIVGGIGVSNIMNVVVEERTKEIGLKMALGAKKRFILSQLIFETLLLTFVGGAIGVFFSYVVCAFFTTSGIEEFIGRPTFSLLVGVVTVCTLGMIGFLAGFSPARQAANMNPVEALRA
jgi:putative ABC transport system permease protein